MRPRLSVSLTVVCLLVLCGSVATGAAPLATFTVEAGEHARVDTPVSAPLTGVPEALSGGSLRLEEVKGSQRVGVPAQVEGGDVPRLWWILSGTTPAGATRVFELVVGEPAQAQAVKAVKGDKSLDIVVGGKNVLQYNHAIVPAPQDLGRTPESRRSLYDRGGFIHPLWSPKGSVLTDIHPADHIHHMGIWMPWTHTRYEGNLVDFWNVGDGTGTVRFSKYLSTTDGPVYGGFQSEQDHVALKTSKGEQVILKEVWDVRAYNVGGPDKGYWLVDFKSTQRCVAEQPLIQEEYRYGGLGFRGARQWKGENSAYLTSEGKTRVDGHATRARWCDNAGVIDGQWEGVTFYSHPDNFGHPEPMRLWPEPDNYIFFNFCPSQLGEWEMKPGEDHVFQYRWYVHEDKIVVADAERVWNDYAHPPQVQAVFNRPAGATALFDGSDPELSLWQRDGGGEIGWQVADDVVQIAPNTGSIVTKQPYRDFILHVEFKTPNMPQARGQARGNSGVYLQKRYELQILDSYGLEPKNNDCGAIYQVKAPDVNACKKPEEWQSYDILFRAARFEGDKKVADARITVYQNGVLIHDDVAIQNKTGAGRPEGPDPGPILLQDHGNRVSFRNLWIAPLEV
ncbi:MAG: PmoA family protein [Sedimentisphaerales bacterium]|nr:PmoA family protein [Sedimentisphaerales bacterium]